jgi:hypothetical protein
MESNPLDNDIYEAELEREFVRVMNNDVAARHGYDTAAAFRMPEEMKLKAAIVAMSNASRNRELRRRTP